jgi:hypothetical protein
VFDPASSVFELNNLLIDRHVTLTMRADTKKIQGAYFRIALARRLAQVREERGVEKLSKDETEAIKDALESELLCRALPSVATTDVAWDIHTGEVFVFSTSEGTLEHVRQLMKETFDVVIAPERTVDWLDDKLGRDDVLARIKEHLPGGPATGENPLEGHELALGSDFLTWLWLQSEASDGLFRVIDGSRIVREVEEHEDDDWNDITETLKHADLTLWIDSRLKLRELVDEDPATTILLGVAPSTTPEARQNLAVGKRPVEAQLGLKLGELECSMALMATGEGIRISGLKLPTTAGDGPEGKLLERLGLLELVHTTLKQLFQQFFQARTSPAWHERVDRFVTEDLAAK